MSPGPSLALVLRNSFRGGRRAGIITAISHATGVGAYALLVALGLATVLTATPAAMQFLQYAGAGYLIWLGLGALGLLRRRATGDSQSGTEPAPDESMQSSTPVDASAWRYARDGALMSVLNPKIAIWFLALFSQFVSELGDSAHTTQHLLMAGVAALVDGLWYCCVVVVVTAPIVARWWLARANTAGVWVERVFGVLLIMLGMRVAIG